MAQKADESEATPSSPTSPESELNCWILSAHEKYDYTIPQFPVLYVELVKVKYLIVEDDKQYRFDGFIRSGPALDTLQFPFQVKVRQRDGFMLHVSTVYLCHSNLMVIVIVSLCDTRTSLTMTHAL